MSDLKLALIIDKSQSYTDFQKERVLKEWNVAPSDLKRIKSLAEAGASTLFGKAPTSILRLYDIDSVKDFFKTLEEVKKADTIKSIASEGLLILTDVARNSTKKLEAIIVELGGEVIASKAGSKDTMSTGERVINDLNFTREVKNYLLAYVGDDYEALIPIARSLSEIPKDQHSRITIEDIYIRLPKSPGTVPPWEIEKPLFGGDITKTIEIFRRIHKNSTLLIVLAVMRNKISLAHKVGALLAADPKMNSASIAEALVVPDNYSLKLATNNYKKFGTERLDKLINLIANAETKVKGGSAMPGDVIMEMMLVEFQRILRS